MADVSDLQAELAAANADAERLAQAIAADWDHWGPACDCSDCAEVGAALAAHRERIGEEE